MSRGPWSQTFTGVAFYPLDPRPEDVRLTDVAHSLAYQCRFGGHCREFYSVAEHCVRASLIVPREDALAALLHDATEAYVVDVPRPVKQVLRDYREVESRVARAVGARFGVELGELPRAVKDADQIMLATEARDLMSKPPAAWEWLPAPLPGRIVPWAPKDAEGRFLERFFELNRRAACS